MFKISQLTFSRISKIVYYFIRNGRKSCGKNSVISAMTRKKLTKLVAKEIVKDLNVAEVSISLRNIDTHQKTPKLIPRMFKEHLKPSATSPPNDLDILLTK